MFHKYIRKMSVVTGLVCLTSLSSASNDNIYTQVTQWVEINSRLTNIEYNLSVVNFESSISDCGYHCQMVKLASLPNRNDGELKMLFRYKNCRSSGDFALPFSKHNNSLITVNPGTYQTVVEGNYCGRSIVTIKLSGDPHSNTGYSIDLMGE